VRPRQPARVRRPAGAEREAAEKESPFVMEILSGTKKAEAKFDKRRGRVSK